jgi:hypothetical protein
MVGCPPYVRFSADSDQIADITPCRRRANMRHRRRSQFDHLVGTDKQRLRHFHAENFGSLEIDDQIIFRRLHDRQIRRIGTFEDSARYLLGDMCRDAWAVTNKPAIDGIIWELVDAGQTIFHRESGECAARVKERTPRRLKAAN